MLKRYLVVGLGNSTHLGTRHNVGFMALDWLVRALTYKENHHKGAPPWQMTRRVEGNVFEAVITPRHAAEFGCDVGVVRAMELALKEGAESKTGLDDKAQAAAAVRKDGGNAAASVITGWPVIFFKPKGFMNFSGKPVLKACREYAIDPGQVIVVHDDLERKVGSVSPKFGGSASGHNGLRSIQVTLGTPDFHRVRVGIDRPVDRDPETVAKYVLDYPREDETERLRNIAYPQIARTVFGLLK
ncbi:hypothetical protein HK101_005542 [Irineochytrium annulatum]|nr:hypothetical protein HK101_005542 [Irineochytrium annulatum]